ncbi:MAG: tetratricopeptide repeat protein [Thermoanaerobaculia bacterium]
MAGPLILFGCSAANQKPPEENPILADLVDYRNGLALLREGRVDESIQLLRRSAASNPRDPNIPNALGLALLYKKDYPAALKAFTYALKLDSSFSESYNNRGVCLIEIGKLDEAEADFQKVLDGPPSNEKANAHFNLGRVQKRREKWADAEREFSLVLSSDSQYRKAFLERGLVRVKRENFREALEDFLFYMKEEPTDPLANYNTALCLLTTGRRDLALRYMERTLAAAPESDEGRRAKRFLESESAMHQPVEVAR